MKRRHVVTSAFLLILPVIVIFALTNYGMQSPARGSMETSEAKPQLKQHCQKKPTAVTKQCSKA